MIHDAGPAFAGKLAISEQVKSLETEIMKSLGELDTILSSGSTMSLEDCQQMLSAAFTVLKNAADPISKLVGPEGLAGSKFTFENIPNSIAFARYLKEYFSAAIRAYSKSIFSPNVLLPFVVPLSHLQYFLMEMVFSAQCEFDLVKFKVLWKRNLNITNRVSILVFDIDFASFISQLYDCYKSIEAILNPTISSVFAKKAGDSFKRLKASLARLPVKGGWEDPSHVLLKNVVVDLGCFKDVLTSYIDKIQSKNASVQAQVKLAPVLKLETILDECLSLYHLREFLTEIDMFIQSDRFEIDPTIFQSKQYRWEFLTQVMELTAVEIQAFGACSCPRSKNIETCIKNGVEAARELVSGLKFKEFPEFSIARYQGNFVNLSQCTFQVDGNPEMMLESCSELVKAMQGSPRIRQINKTFDALKDMSVTKSSGKKAGVEENAEWFAALMSFEDSIIGTKKSSNVRSDASIWQFKTYIAGQFFPLKLYKVLNQCLSFIPTVSNSDKITTSEVFKSSNTELLEMIVASMKAIIANQSYDRDGETLLTLFCAQLEFFEACVSACMGSEVKEIMQCGLAILPPLTLIQRALPVEGMMERIHGMVKDIQTKRLVEANMIQELAENPDKAPAKLASLEGTRFQINKLLKMVDEVRMIVQFLGLYTELGPFRTIGQSVYSEYEQIKPKTKHFREFLAFSNHLTSLLRFKPLPNSSLTSLVKCWLHLARSFASPDTSERKAMYEGTLEAMPIIDMSKEIQEGFCILEIIIRKILEFEENHPECDCTAMIDSFYDLQNGLMKAVTTGDLTSTRILEQGKTLLSEIMKLSDQLCTEILRYWGNLASFFKIISLMKDLSESINHMNQIFDTQREDGYIYTTFFWNFVYSVKRTMVTAKSGNMAPEEIIRNTEEHEESLRKQKSRVDFDTAYQMLVSECLTSKQIWSEDLLHSMGLKCKEHIMTLITTIATRDDEDYSHTISKLLQINDMLDAVENEDTDKFGLMLDIKMLYREVEEVAIRANHSSAEFITNIVDYGLSVMYIIKQLAIMDMFISEAAKRRGPNISMRSTEPRKRTPDPKQHANEITELIGGLPLAMSELECTVSELPDDADPERVEKLQSSVQTLSRMAKEFHDDLFADVCEHDAELAEQINTILTENAELAQQLARKQEEYSAQRLEWIEFQRAIEADRSEQRERLTEMRRANDKKNLELERLTTELEWRKTMHPARDACIHPAPTEIEEPCDDIAMYQLTSQLNAELERNKILRRKLNTDDSKHLRMIEIELGREPVHIMPESEQNAFEQSLLDAIDRFRNNATKGECEYQTTAKSVILNLDKLILLNRLQKQKNEKLSTELKGLNEVVRQTKSALLALLEQA